jgi:hypothetical protein
VSFRNASAGITASVVSTVALAIVPLSAVEPLGCSTLRCFGT